MLEVKNVSLGYGNHIVVQNVSMRLDQGEIGCLLGPSGCGKTTLLRAIAGFEPVRAGQIDLQGKTVASLALHVPPQARDIGMVFQDHALFPHLSVGDNIGFGLHRMAKPLRAARVHEMLELVGLEGMGQRWPHELSGGQQQRVALARALAPRPSLLLMDEPFSSLDTSMRESIAREVRAILKQAKATALMVTHDQNEAFAMADNVGVMARGQLMQWGNAVQVYCAPATQDVAQFVGDGALVSAQATAGGQWQTALGLLPSGHPHYQTAQGVQVLLRPEHVAVVEKGVRAQVRERTFRGSHFVFELELPDGQAVMAKVSLNALYGACESVQIALSPEL
ncbi:MULTISPECIES: ABC transporter ATP-binding protein [Comamonas]|uniref:ABC transporter ATP-binding protein n=1 Tax=Comamonas TaxID=283 RepID=UPI00257FF157|nr:MULTISPECIES: ABC transporter ATP-binding protein [Comamonas]